MKSNFVRGIALSCLGAVLAAAPAPAADLDTARQLFYEADFEMALVEIDWILAEEKPRGTELRNAQSLAAQCHARLGRDEQAVEAFCGAITADAEWRPDAARYSPDELDLFHRARERCAVETANQSPVEEPAELPMDVEIGEPRDADPPIPNPAGEPATDLLSYELGDDPEALPEPSLDLSTAPSPKSWYQNKAVWIGTGVVLTTIVLVAGGGDEGGGSDQVPAFPDPPGASVRLRW